MTAANDIHPQSRGAGLRCGAVPQMSRGLKMLVRPVRIHTPIRGYRRCINSGSPLVRLPCLSSGCCSSIPRPPMPCNMRRGGWWFARKLPTSAKARGLPGRSTSFFLAALPVASRASQLVLAAVMVRVGFCSWRSACRPVCLFGQKHDRAQAAQFGRYLRCHDIRAFHWTPTFASLPSGHATTAFAALAAIARCGLGAGRCCLSTPC